MMRRDEWIGFVGVPLAVVAFMLIPLSFLIGFGSHTVKTTVVSKHWYYDRCGAKIYHDCTKYHLVIVIEGHEIHWEDRDYSGWYNKVPVGAEVEVQYSKTIWGQINDEVMRYPVKSP